MAVLFLLYTVMSFGMGSEEDGWMGCEDLISLSCDAVSLVPCGFLSGRVCNGDYR